jgi:hypothetical protein
MIEDEVVGSVQSTPQKGMLAKCSREVEDERIQTPVGQRLTELGRAGIQPAR